MSDAIPIDLSGSGHLVDPPIVDFLTYEPALSAFVAEFVPEPVISNERKESVFILDGTNAARRVREYLEMLAQVCGISGENR